ncbi:MAG: MBL fold metallo-hydrolase [Lachnospiraceae bacterium]|nr:MBL fold metallo-hydrolase [Lachnospiraceae bacterium]
MNIINLIENTEGRCGCVYAHGLSFYVETERHRLLLDLGPSEETLRNAKVLGIDLTAVDTVILSHGHYDHSGGIIPFSEVNDKAVIYMQASATDDYYADDGENAPVRFRYIGIDKSIASLPQVRFLNGDTVIDDELELFVIRNRSHEFPSTNRNLLVRGEDCYRRDEFGHEHVLVVRQNGKSVLMSGCAHNGILSILDAYTDRYGSAPDLVVSGFHLMKKTEYSADEIAEIEAIAEALRTYPTKFYTCHCTGTVAFDVMKNIMGDQLAYVHSGDVINVTD